MMTNNNEREMMSQEHASGKIIEKKDNVECGMWSVCAKMMLLRTFDHIDCHAHAGTGSTLARTCRR